MSKIKIIIALFLLFAIEAVHVNANILADEAAFEGKSENNNSRREKSPNLSVKDALTYSHDNYPL
ncbi:MAG: hypothetical protein LBF71_04290 [Campylobacteraceae bacterium]|jgi:hypothetical protein|nr:hypothetical protein [Campylobacteraceae bacterium]